MALLRELLRARALEDLRAQAIADSGTPVPSSRAVSPGLPAARALRRAEDGSGDVFSLRVGSPVAALALGLDPREIFRQALGRATAPAGGRDSGGFPTDLSRGLLGPVVLPGILVEVMAGIALSFRLRGEPRVALLVDDLAGTGSGDWHEGLNFAAVREVPMVLVVDQSHGNAIEAPVRSLGERAAAYGFEAYRVDGTDPRAVEAEVRRAVEAARLGAGLQVVDVIPPQRDPLDWLIETHQAEDRLTAESLDGLRVEAEAEMRDALKEVQSEPGPDPLPALPPGDRPSAAAGSAAWPGGLP